MHYLIHTSSGDFVCRAKLADTFFSRAIGLMFRRDLAKDEGLLIKFPGYAKGAAIHSFFMRFPIDLYFIGEDMHVIEHATLKPWSWYKPSKACDYVLEVKAGSVALKSGERLRLTPLP
jgi:hypothetical protein